MQFWYWATVINSLQSDAFLYNTLEAALGGLGLMSSNWFIVNLLSTKLFSFR